MFIFEFGYPPPPPLPPHTYVYTFTRAWSTIVTMPTFFLFPFFAQAWPRINDSRMLLAGHQFIIINNNSVITADEQRKETFTISENLTVNNFT